MKIRLLCLAWSWSWPFIRRCILIGDRTFTNRGVMHFITAHVSMLGPPDPEFESYLEEVFSSPPTKP